MSDNIGTDEIVERAARVICAGEYDEAFWLHDDADCLPRAQWINAFWKLSIPLARKVIDAINVAPEAGK